MWEAKKSASSAILIAVVLLVIVPTACNNGNSRTYSVGIINVVSVLDESLTGFKKGMTEMGYIEGKNIRYLYNGASTDLSKLPAEARTLLTAKVDLILTVTTPATLAAKKATADIGLPVVFAVVTDPVGAGIVESMQRPGGNITGVAFGIAEARRLEWLLRIAPEIQRIYIPFNPTDASPVLALKMVRNAAAKLGAELITRKVYDPETVHAAVLNIPVEADAVFLLPDSLMSTRMTELLMEAVKHRKPVSVPNVSNVKNNGALTCFGVDLKLTGQQAARLADQILKGAIPANLPVETAELYLAINLKTAATIGLTIPDEILRHAHLIVR